MGRRVTFGEVLMGIALTLGLLTGIAAFFGVFMNMTYLLAGTFGRTDSISLMSTDRHAKPGSSPEENVPGIAVASSRATRS